MEKETAPICLLSEAACRTQAIDLKYISSPDQESSPEDHGIIKKRGKKGGGGGGGSPREVSLQPEI